MENVVNILNDIVINDYNIDKEMEKTIKKWVMGCNGAYEIFEKVKSDSINFMEDNKLPLKSYEYLKAINILYKYLYLDTYTGRNNYKVDDGYEGFVLCNMSINTILSDKLNSLSLLYNRRIASKMVGERMILTNYMENKESLYHILEPNFAFFRSDYFSATSLMNFSEIVSDLQKDYTKVAAMTSDTSYIICINGISSDDLFNYQYILGTINIGAKYVTYESGKKSENIYAFQKGPESIFTTLSCMDRLKCEYDSVDIYMVNYLSYETRKLHLDKKDCKGFIRYNKKSNTIKNINNYLSKSVAYENDIDNIKSLITGLPNSIIERYYKNILGRKDMCSTTELIDNLIYIYGKLYMYSIPLASSIKDVVSDNQIAVLRVHQIVGLMIADLLLNKNNNNLIHIINNPRKYEDELTRYFVDKSFDISNLEDKYNYISSLLNNLVDVHKFYEIIDVLDLILLLPALRVFTKLGENK